MTDGCKWETCSLPCSMSGIYNKHRYTNPHYHCFGAPNFCDAAYSTVATLKDHVRRKHPKSRKLIPVEFKRDSEAAFESPSKRPRLLSSTPTKDVTEEAVSVRDKAYENIDQEVLRRKLKKLLQSKMCKKVNKCPMYRRFSNDIVIGKHKGPHYHCLGRPSFCDKTTTQASDMLKHILRYHPKEAEELECNKIPSTEEEESDDDDEEELSEFESDDDEQQDASYQGDMVAIDLNSTIHEDTAVATSNNNTSNHKTIQEYTTHDVSEWLTQIGLHTMAVTFFKEEIDGEVLNSITEEDTHQPIFNMSFGSRRKFLIHLQQLKDGTTQKLL
ncbi:hypothetical protein AKO1_009068 [Acrasis kona]|uniref:SAM domain-containing protein n=1 Tax=Acrasis kona TaxID=1008807 RepID=A0AAW2ZI81_9EUKA